MRGLLQAITVLAVVLATAAAAALFMILSPSVVVSPETILTGTVEGILLLAVAVAALGAVILRRS